MRWMVVAIWPSYSSRAIEMIYAVDFIMSGTVWAESARNQRRCLSLLRDLHQESATPIATLTGVTSCKMVNPMRGRRAKGGCLS